MEGTSSLHSIFCVLTGLAVLVQDALTNTDNARLMLEQAVQEEIVVILEDVWDGNIIERFEIGKVCSNTGVVVFHFASCTTLTWLRDLTSMEKCCFAKCTLSILQERAHATLYLQSGGVYNHH